MFAGYYHDDESDADRLRDGMFWSGDLVYRDRTTSCTSSAGPASGCGWTARTSAPVRSSGSCCATRTFAEVAVYAVPDPEVGDQVMAAVVLRGEERFDPDDFAEFLTIQPDLGPKQVPRFVRLTTRLPRTSTYKVLKRTLSAQRWRTPDPVWWREGRELTYSPLTEASDPIRLDWGARSVRR